MGPGDRWRVTELGRGVVGRRDDGYDLTLPPAAADRYHDAQISDYDSALTFSDAPPLRLSVRARALGQLRGTAGFGFWNHAFMPGQRRFRPPQALWFFFASPPSDIALARDVAGAGWKAAAFDARNARFYALLPLALPGFLLMRSRRLYRALWPIGQRALGVREAAFDAALLHDWHHYQIEWRADGASFRVDGALVLSLPNAPRNPLGFVAWLDNQYAVVTPQGRFGWGLLDVPARQSLQLRDLRLDAPA